MGAPRHEIYHYVRSMALRAVKFASRVKSASQVKSHALRAVSEEIREADFKLNEFVLFFTVGATCVALRAVKFRSADLLRDQRNALHMIRAECHYSPISNPIICFIANGIIQPPYLPAPDSKATSTRPSW